MFEEYTFSKFKFPNNISDKAVIGVLFRTINKDLRIETQKVLKYYNFMIKDNKRKIYNIDIPIYNPNLPEGFSIFCTKLEENMINEYIKKNVNKKEKEKERIEDIDIEIEPSKNHFYCQLCKCKFESYKMHCSSMLHSTKIIDKSNQFFSIKNTLNRINDFWKNQNEKKVIEDKKVNKKNENEKKELRSKKEVLNNLLCEQSTNDTLIGNHENISQKKIFTQSFLSMNKGISSFDSLKKQSLLFKIKKRNYQEYVKKDLHNTFNNNTKNKNLIINPTIFMKLILEEKQKILNPKYTNI